MRAIKIICFISFFFLAIGCAFSAGIREANNTQPSAAENAAMNNQDCNNMETTIKITGRVQVYGNEPFTFVGIIDQNDTEYSVYPPEKEKELIPLQGHLIEFTAILLNEPQGFGSLSLKGGTVTPITWEILR